MAFFIIYDFKSWQRPTLPHSYPCSTIGDERLNCCVRNGNRCFPLSITTRTYHMNFIRKIVNDINCIFLNFFNNL